jgi:hypothetical protein
VTPETPVSAVAASTPPAAPAPSLITAADVANVTPKQFNKLSATQKAAAQQTADVLNAQAAKAAAVSQVPPAPAAPPEAPVVAPAEAPPVAAQTAETPQAQSALPASATPQQIAQALRDEMARSGTLPPPEAPEGPAPNVDTLTSQMRDIPAQIRKEATKSNYRAIKEGDPSASPDTASPTYEAAGRLNKAGNVAQALHEHGVGFSEAKDGMKMNDWKTLFTQLGERVPSQKTVAETLLQLKALEAQK